MRKHEKTERESSKDGGTGREDGRRLLISHYVSGVTHKHSHASVGQLRGGGELSKTRKYCGEY